MISQPLFSVLVANYNNGKYFKDCFDSLINQSYTHFEVIIVDDCSKDDSTEMIQNIIKEDSRFKLWINDENKGCGFTKRRCAELANGEICGFLDPDDTLTPSAIELMVNAHLENPNCSLIHSKCYYCNENLEITGVYVNGKNVTRSDYFFNLEGDIFHFATFKNNLYKKTSGIDSYLQRAVDQDLYLKLYEVGETLFLDDALYHYRIHENGISTNSNKQKAEYWRWVVNIKTAERRDLNIENMFIENYATRRELNTFKWKYYSLKKFEFIQKMYDKIKPKKSQ